MRRQGRVEGVDEIRAPLSEIRHANPSTKILAHRQMTACPLGNRRQFCRRPFRAKNLRLGILRVAGRAERRQRRSGMPLEPASSHRTPQRTLDPGDVRPVFGAECPTRAALHDGTPEQFGRTDDILDHGSAARIERSTPRRLTLLPPIGRDRPHGDPIFVRRPARTSRGTSRAGRFEKSLAEIAAENRIAPEFALLRVAEAARQCRIDQLSTHVPILQPASEVAYAWGRPNLASRRLVRAINRVRERRGKLGIGYEDGEPRVHGLDQPGSQQRRPA